MDFRTTRLEGAKCPHCGCPNDGATSVAPGEITPVPGDFCVCFECGGAGRYTDDMQIRALVDEDGDDADPETLLQLLIIQTKIVQRIREEAKAASKH